MSVDLAPNTIVQGEKSLLRQRIIVVLNTGSGSCDEASAGQAEEIFQTAGLPPAKVISVGPDSLEAALDDAAAIEMGCTVKISIVPLAFRALAPREGPRPMKRTT